MEDNNSSNALESHFTKILDEMFRKEDTPNIERQRGGVGTLTDIAEADLEDCLFPQDYFRD